MVEVFVSWKCLFSWSCSSWWWFQSRDDVTLGEMPFAWPFHWREDCTLVDISLWGRFRVRGDFALVVISRSC